MFGFMDSIVMMGARGNHVMTGRSTRWGKGRKKHHFEAVELQAASGHNANVSVAERFLPQKQLAMARVNCNKGNAHSPLSTVINDLIIVSMKQIL